MSQIRRILCPTDFSPTSEHAVAYAVALARQVGASVHLLHAWELPIYTFLDGVVLPGPEALAQVTTQLQKQLNDAVEKHRGPDVPIEGHLMEGPAAGEIVRMIDVVKADLIVMGTHGRTGLPRMWLGSVAERVVRSSSIPVLAVPPAEKAHPHEVETPTE